MKCFYILLHGCEIYYSVQEKSYGQEFCVAWMLLLEDILLTCYQFAVYNSIKRIVITLWTHYGDAFYTQGEFSGRPYDKDWTISTHE